MRCAAAANEINKSKRALNEGYEGDYADRIPSSFPQNKWQKRELKYNKDSRQAGSRRERGGEVGSLLIPLAIAFIQFALIQMNSRRARQLLSLCAYLLCNLALPNFRLRLY